MVDNNARNEQRSLPKNLEFETTVLGSVMSEPDLFHECQLTADDFWDTETRNIWAAVTRRMEANPTVPIDPKAMLSEKGIDAVTLMRCVGVPVGQISTLHMAGILRHLSRCRKLAMRSESILNLSLAAVEHEKLSEALGIATEELNSDGLVSHDTETTLAESSWQRYTTRQPQSNDRIDFGMATLDDLLYGLRGGRLYCIAGRPGDGKSALALKLIDAAVRSRRRVNFHSLEMGTNEIMDRWLAMRTGIKHGRIAYAQLSDDEQSKIRSELVEISSAKGTLRLYVAGTQSTTKIQSEMRRVKPELVVIDYLQLLHSESPGLGMKAAATRDRELSQMTSRLKALARDGNCAVVILSQLNRQIERRDDPMPQLSDLRESGGIEADCDVVLFCVAPVKRKKGSDGNMEKDDGKRLIRVAKNRHGKCGNVDVLFDFSTMRVGEVEAGQ